MNEPCSLIVATVVLSLFVLWFCVVPGHELVCRVAHGHGHSTSRGSRPRTNFFTPLHWSTLWAASRGALRNVNRTSTFFPEVTGTEQASLTATPLYHAVYREILTSCEPGRPVKQARFPVGLLVLVENFVTTDSNPAHMRMCGWWVLLESWGTMRFLDHRGLGPSRHHFQRWESNRTLEEDEDHRNRQERVCEANESGRKFIHLFAPSSSQQVGRS